MFLESKLMGLSVHAVICSRTFTIGFVFSVKFETTGETFLI